MRLGNVKFLMVLFVKENAQVLSGHEHGIVKSFDFNDTGLEFNLHLFL